MFEKFSFTPRQVEKYYRSAHRDLIIAGQTNIPEVVFKFCYDALLKLAITVCAKNNIRAKSRQGHHIELIRKLADILGDRDIEAIGNEMRSKRNWDIYSGGILISKKETDDYLKWIKNIFKKTNDYLGK